MAKVETFTPELLKEHLDKANIKYDQKAEDHFVLGFGKLFEHNPNTVLQVMVNRDQSKRQLMIHCMIGKPVPAERHDISLAACNRWNAEFIYPTVFIRELQAKDQNQQDHRLNVFFTKSAIDVSKGIHNEMLEVFLRNSIGAARDFFNWINREVEGGQPAEQPQGAATDAPPTIGDGEFKPAN
ncbi:MAG: YbjN domain-containing protein [Phycisphaeraceae bacterium]|nr:YbjN domain-containing protein [Phycisphaeraceae bacterium]